jgi:hypothetical protein
VNGAIGLCGRLGQNADEIDDDIRARDCLADSDVVKHIGLDELRCLGRFSRHQETVGMARGDAHRRATSKQQRDQMAADEAGSAEHRDAAGHNLSPWHYSHPGSGRVMDHPLDRSCSEDIDHDHVVEQGRGTSQTTEIDLSRALRALFFPGLLFTIVNT